MKLIKKKLFFIFFMISIFTIQNTFFKYNNLVYSANYDMYEEEDELIDKKNHKKNELKDPFESINRAIFSFNMFTMDNIGVPTIKFYRKAVGKDVHWMISNLGNRLYDFSTLFNSILQFDFVNSIKTIATFSINMVFGVFGLFNPAEKLGIYRKTKKFGETLAFYNVGEGFYVVLPLLGPSNARDSLSISVDYLADPLAYNYFNVIKKESLIPDNLAFEEYFVKYIDNANRITSLHEQLISKSLDPYNFVKNAYIQNLNSKKTYINNKVNNNNGQN